MAGLLRPFFRRVATYLGLNPDVSTDIVYERSYYRPAPASSAAPKFTGNFPLKQRRVADLGGANRSERIARMASYVIIPTAHEDPAKDQRNIWHLQKRSPGQSVLGVPSHQDFHWQYISPKEEAQL